MKDPDKDATADNDSRPEWHTPVLIEQPIVDATKHMFSSGIDRYEGTNPTQYGS